MPSASVVGVACHPFPPLPPPSRPAPQAGPPSSHRFPRGPRASFLPAALESPMTSVWAGPWISFPNEGMGTWWLSEIPRISLSAHLTPPGRRQELYGKPGGYHLLACVLGAASPGSLPALVTRPGQPALWEGAAVPATPPPAWRSGIGNWELTSELTLEIPMGGQGNSEASSKVGGTGTHGDM